MSRRDWPQRLRRLTAEALDGYAVARAEAASRRREPAAPGDIFLFSETAELPVEWAVIGRHPQDPRLLLAVPADTSPLVGSADVEVPATVTTGPLSLRCRFAVWRGDDDFDPELRTRRLEPMYTRRAWGKWLALERRALEVTDSAWEIDHKPEYEDWLEVLTKARAACDTGERRGTVHEPGAERAGGASAVRPWVLAASILLALMAGLVWGLLLPARQAIEAPRINVPFAYLKLGEALRSQRQILVVPAGTDLFLVLVPITDSTPYPRYRIEILRHDTGQEVWSSDGLVKQGTTELSFTLPLGALHDGEYRLRVFGLRGTQAEPVAETALVIELPKGDRGRDRADRADRI